MILSEAAAKRLTAKVLALSQAESCTVSVKGSERGNVRFALNSGTTNGFQDDLSLSIESNFGKRSGSTTINQPDDETIAAAVRKSEEIARLAPENPEFVPPLGKQSYRKGSSFDAGTASVAPSKLASLCRPVLKESLARNVTAAGYLDAGANFSASATSKGLFVYDKSTGVDFTVTVRTPDGTGSGWAGKNYHDLKRLDTNRLGKLAVNKGAQSRQPVAVEPGKYVVILEPSAVCDLVGYMVWGMDARQADEGRSFLTRKGGGNKLGEKLFDERVTIFSDPNYDLAPGRIYSDDGLPARKRHWVENGCVANLIYPRYWAQKSNREPVPSPTNLIMLGGNSSVDEMIQDTKRGILVTRLWYIRTVDPRTLLLTGLTRDGTFLIENGRISKPIKNFRFNESPLAMLSNIVAMGPTERARGSEIEDASVAVPTLLVKDFTFSSLSDAV